jgi:hypothetical protein
MLEELEGCECVQRVQGLRGACYVVRNAGLLMRYVSQVNPLGIDNRSERPTSRADAVLRFGNAKAASAADCMGVFVRSTRPGMVLTSTLGVIPISDLTCIGGGAAVLLQDGVQWRFSGTSVALIENAEAFWHHEQVLPQVDLAIWTVGRISAKRLLEWLASPPMAHCQYIHWGDYDPTGVAEYIRVRKACPGRVVMWIPDGLDKLFQQYGKQSLLLKKGNARIYVRLRAYTEDATVARLVQLFDTYHVGVEQEVCLLAQQQKS